VRQALESGPKYFVELMEGLGTDDGRGVVIELDRLRQDGMLDRGSNGEWLLKPQAAR
jgi:2,5-furandicarboxylate decarboxylase 1